MNMSIHIPYEHLTTAQKLFLYVDTRQPVLDERAIFSDGTAAYRSPQEPTDRDEITIRIRSGKSNIDKVYLCYGEERLEMTLAETDELFDFYEGVIGPFKESIPYYFELHSGNLKVYYNKKGVTREPEWYYHFNIVPGFKTPDWAKGAIMYQIFTDRFYNGDKSNDVVDDEYHYVGKLAKAVTDWNKIPDADGIREFYGGDLQGVIDKMDYLKELGVDVIYLNPIFVSPSNHKYDTQDYDSIDPHYGRIVLDGGQPLSEAEPDNNLASKYITRTTERANIEASNLLFAQMVEEAHQRGMKVILDGVFNHCGSFNKWMDREKFYANGHDYAAGAYASSASPYSNFFNFHNKTAWPDNPHYDGWWGYDTLPKLNYEGSPKLYNYILDVGRKWVSPPYNADGWRLDVAADLGYTKEFNHKFWRDFRKAVKGAKDDAIILAEHYGDPSDWIRHGDQWDTVMNYDAFMEPVTWFLTGMEKHSDEFRGDLLGNHRAFFDAMIHHMSRFHNQSLQVAMNELSNHDHSRFLTRTNHKVGRTHTLGPQAASEDLNMGIMHEAVVIQMTWPGAPTIYYGDEAGVCGWTDPDNRRTYPWGNENKTLLNLHKALISIRKASKVLKTGSIKFLHGEHNIISYGRFDDENRLVVVCNNSHDERKVRIPVWEIGIHDVDLCQQILETTKDGYNTNSESYQVIRGKIEVTLKPFSTKIIKEKTSTSR